MRLISLDYLLAGAVIAATAVFGANSALKIEDNLNHRSSAQQSTIKFSLGEQRYLVTTKDGCVGSLTVRAGTDSVTAVLVNGKIRIQQGQLVANATTEASFGFNPLLQLYEASMSASLESQKLLDIKLKNVRPHDITVSGLFGENPIKFSAPGPITLSRNADKISYTVHAPDSLALPVNFSSFDSIADKLGVQLILDSSSNSLARQSCNNAAINLKEIEARIRSFLPKGVPL